MKEESVKGAKGRGQERGQQSGNLSCRQGQTKSEKGKRFIQWGEACLRRRGEKSLFGPGKHPLPRLHWLTPLSDSG